MLNTSGSIKHQTLSMAEPLLRLKLDPQVVESILAITVIALSGFAFLL